jgi:hypothetical protein
MVNEPAPLFLDAPALLRLLFSTFLATLVGGGGGAGGGGGVDILGADMHIVLFVG